MFTSPFLAYMNMSLFVFLFLEMFKKVLEFTMTPAGIDTAKLYPILMSSGLPREALGQIWASANRTTPGMLTKEELYTVLALIGVAQVNTGVKTNYPLSTTTLIIPCGVHRASP